MVIEGTLRRDHGFWLAEVPILDAMTQARTRKEALCMAGDLVETLADAEGFKAVARSVGEDRIQITCSDTRVLVALILRRQRQCSGLSLAEVARRLKAKSRNGYARYEQGRSVPSVEKLTELLQAVSGRDFVIRPSHT